MEKYGLDGWMEFFSFFHSVIDIFVADGKFKEKTPAKASFEIFVNERRCFVVAPVINDGDDVNVGLSLSFQFNSKPTKVLVVNANTIIIGRGSMNNNTLQQSDKNDVRGICIRCLCTKELKSLHMLLYLIN